jgi:hypothetical protein
MDFINKHSKTISIVVAVVAILVVMYYINNKISQLSLTVKQTQKMVSVHDIHLNRLKDKPTTISSNQIQDFLMAQPIIVEQEPEVEEVVVEEVDEYDDEELDKVVEMELQHH